MAIHLVIKGNVAQATAAARDRGISLNQCYRNARNHNETNARCAEDYRTRMMAWFAEEPRQAPYPIGALLLFS